MKLTDSGRQVTGGGGITPDMVVSAPKLDKIPGRAALSRRCFLPSRDGSGGFTRYFLGTKPTITKDFEVDDEVMRSFRDYLTKHKIRYTEPDMAENMDWIKRKIKQEVFMSDVRAAGRL